MDRGREPPIERDRLAADVEAIVESDTDTLVGAVSRGEIAAPELEALCRAADAESVGIDDGALSLVRIVAPLVTQHSERSDDTTP